MVRVLVVDDELGISESLGLILGDAGYEVRCVADGRAALDKASEWHPDVILSDLNMPRMGGEELLDRLRRTRTLAHVPMIAMSALAPKTTQRFSGFLQKPFSILAMLSLIRETVR